VLGVVIKLRFGANRWYVLGGWLNIYIIGRVRERVLVWRERGGGTLE